MFDPSIRIDGENGVNPCFFMSPFPTGRHKAFVTELISQLSNYLNIVTVKYLVQIQDFL